MDSVTQMALGAAMGEAVLGRRLGNKAMLLGAVVGSLPDLDVLVPFAGAVESFTYHRSFSHSLLVLSLISPVVALLLQKIVRSNSVSFSRWWLMAWLALITHPLLDSFTVYGTQLFWPLSDYPVSGSSIFIIDPVYTLILIAGLIAAFRRTTNGHLFNTLAIALSCGYLAWSMTARHLVQTKIEQSLAQQAIGFQSLLVTPMPFNTIGWRFIAMQDNGYRTGFYSLLDPAGSKLATYHYDSDESLLNDLENHWPVGRLKKFTHGFYKVQRVENEIQMVDLRMGIEKSYIFAFTVGELTNDGVVAVDSREAQSNRDFSAMSAVMKRIFDPAIDLEQR